MHYRSGSRVDDRTGINIPGSAGEGPTAYRSGGVIAWLRWGLVSALVVLGAVLRVWYLFHRPVNSDEAIVGLMADQILHGHFTAFYWGQVYGGSAEPLVVAPFLALFGSSTIVLSGVQAVLSGVSAADQFGATVAIQGPGGLPEASFISYLHRSGIEFRLIRAGLVDAVIPTHQVLPERAGLASPASS